LRSAIAAGKRFVRETQHSLHVAPGRCLATVQVGGPFSCRHSRRSHHYIGRRAILRNRFK
jgi:hypothetical protein